MMGLNVASAGYDPLRTKFDFTVEEMTFRNGDRQVPCKIYIPSGIRQPTPVILFSHGLGGTNGGADYLGRHWAARGYVTVFLQHPGSDAGLWQGKDPKTAVKSLKEAANWKNHLLRVEDVKSPITPGELPSYRVNLGFSGVVNHRLWEHKCPIGQTSQPNLPLAFEPSFCECSPIRLVAKWQTQKT